jgi:CHAD domain-containing protein
MTDLVTLAPPGPTIDVPSVEEALRRRHAVQAHRTRPVRVRRLDTFDARLARAGLRLELRSAADERLELAADDGVIVAAVEKLTLPAFSAALPDGPLRARLAPVMGVRALTAVTDERRRERRMDLRNEDGKLVARVLVDDPAAVSVRTLRGYDSDGRRAVRALEATGLRPLPAEPDRPAGDAEPVLGPPDGPATAYVAGVLRGFLEAMSANLPGLLDDIDTEFLHDFRVAVRRTRSTLKLARPALAADLRETWEPAFKWLGDLTTPVRDLDVHLLDLPVMAGWLVAAAPDDLAAFAAHVRRRRAGERRRLVRGLRSERYRRLAAEWDERLVTLAGSEPADGSTARGLARTATHNAARRVLRRGSAVHADSPAADLHSLRKRCKELRYALEVFAPLSDQTARKSLVSDLKVLQDVLGRFQDTEVQRHALRGFADEMVAEGTPTEALLAMGELIGHLDAAQDDARGEFDDAFARFARPANRRRLDDLTGRG